MADFGTGLRAHIAGARDLVLVDTPAFCPEPPRGTTDEELQRLRTVAAELEGRELALAQREAELTMEHERIVLALARVLLQQAQQVEPEPEPLDELAALRARRYGAAS